MFFDFLFVLLLLAADLMICLRLLMITYQMGSIEHFWQDAHLRTQGQIPSRIIIIWPQMTVPRALPLIRLMHPQ